MTIYFIRAVDCGRIKIGFTDAPNPDGRLGSLQTGNPSELVVLAHCEGAEERERHLHELFSASRVRGEWFTPSAKLDSLIAYAKARRTTEGWEASELGAEKWADMVEQFAKPRRVIFRSTKETQIDWRASVRREFEKQQARAKPESTRESVRLDWAELDLWEFWSVERGIVANPVVHSTQNNEYRATEFGWLVNGARVCDSKAAMQTVRMLSGAKTPDDIVAIWIGACVHELTNSKRGNAAFAEERVPGIFAIARACHARMSSRWPHLGVHAVPLHFSLPERCVLSNKEFLHMVARHMRATLSCCVPIAIWAHGSACGVPGSRDEVAA